MIKPKDRDICWYTSCHKSSSSGAELKFSEPPIKPVNVRLREIGVLDILKYKKNYIYNGYNQETNTSINLEGTDVRTGKLVKVGGYGEFFRTEEEAIDYYNKELLDIADYLTSCHDRSKKRLKDLMI